MLSNSLLDRVQAYGTTRILNSVDVVTLYLKPEPGSFRWPWQGPFDKLRLYFSVVTSSDHACVYHNSSEGYNSVIAQLNSRGLTRND